MPIPQGTVAVHSGAAPGTSRSAVPARMSATAPARTRPRPQRREASAPTGANNPMHTTGSVVSNPAAVALSRRSRAIGSTSGGIDAMGVRRLSATSTSAQGHQPSLVAALLSPDDAAPLPLAPSVLTASPAAAPRSSPPATSPPPGSRPRSAAGTAGADA